ncbi:MAG: SDR family oxidoreductase [Gammaproteobacteria bacterium]|nr:SDR family oxidoreductase [Gammaproteobacteria bacterium]
MSMVLVLGAKSDIAKAVARKYAKQGYDLYLAARGVESLQELASDIEIRSQVNVAFGELDILDFASHQGFYESLPEQPMGVISAIGYLGSQQTAQISFDEAQKIINTNYLGITSLFDIIAHDFEARGSGFMIGISSVAGDRGRKSNYCYGAAKAAFSAYLSGLRNRLHDSKVQVLTAKPGFVATSMTAGMDLPARLTAQPEQVADDIFNAQQKGKNIIYSKWIWRWIMLVIKHIPEWKFKGMSL